MGKTISNVFCATGAGGGVDPSCSLGGSTGSREPSPGKPLTESEAKAAYPHMAHLLNGSALVGLAKTKGEAYKWAKDGRARGQFTGVFKDDKTGKWLLTVPAKDTFRTNAEMEQITRTLKVNRARRISSGGREYLVAPLTLIVPGVLNGSQGPLYYPEDEIAKNADDWNGVPIVLRHPVDKSGNHVSARAPDVIENQGLGYVYKAKANGKLKAEGWFDVEKTMRVAPDLVARIDAGKSVELSTGLFTENEVAENGANHNGTVYTHIARNYRPDHLAILPDQEGACSVRDGCGVNVNTRTRKSKSTPNNGGQDMAKKPLTENQKKTIVDNLIGNCGDCGWTEEDRETLNAFSDEKLMTMDECRKKMATNAKALEDATKAKTDAEAKVTELTANAEKAKKEGEKKVEKQPLTNAEVEAALSPEMKANLAFGAKKRAEWREQLIERLTANVEDEDQRAKVAERLAKESDEALEVMEQIAPKPPQNVVDSQPDYLGQAAGTVTTNKAKLTYVGLPGETYAGAKM